ncbi:hypothetical protein SKAU_G00326210 [Synaphobranchus kaupii]|uniref:Uncharacterized protein n=1 Tax=Synaphobranchus kaupii TaxID=118154 RepID=A0A9Q1EPV9_SYNKA|nr:hypothetical protein SKAU_G00326210 [Synaphobranchus kaupii]
MLESPGYQLERLHTEVMSLCSRIELIPCNQAKDRLAQSVFYSFTLEVKHLPLVGEWLRMTLENREELKLNGINRALFVISKHLQTGT